MNESKPNKYFAFISYKREDEEWAIWFHHELENYHLPISLNGRADLPTEFRPVFRDIDELKAGNLPEQIYNALASSAHLVVICSPNSAKSEWVNKEIKDFINIGKTKGIDNVRKIFPFIVDGRPHAQNESEECFPKVLLELSKNEEIVGGNVNEGNLDWCGNVNESGRDKAFVKVLAGMLPNVAFDDLWNRYEHDKAEEERLKREERERFLRIQSRLVSEKVINLSHDSSLAQRLALEVIPKDLNNPNRPFTVEAERALRQSAFQHHITLKGHFHDISDLSFSSDGKHVASISDDFTIRIWDTETGSLIRVLDSSHPCARRVLYTPDDKSIIVVYGDGAFIMFDAETGESTMILSFNQMFNTKRPATCISSMAISPDGNRLAIATSEGDIFFKDFNTDEILSVEIEPILSIVFSPDSKKMVSTSYDGLIIWNLEDGSRCDISIEEGLEPYQAYATFSSDGKQIAFIFDNIMGLLDVAEGGRVQTFGKTDSLYLSVSFCDDDKHINSLSDNGSIMTWDIETLKAIYGNYEINQEVSYAKYCVKGNQVGIVVNKDTILIRDSLPSVFFKSLIEKNEHLGCVSFSPDGKYILTSSVEEENSSVLCIRDINTGKILRKLIGHYSRIWSAAFSQDGKLIVSASDGTIRIWNSNDGSFIKLLNYHSSDHSTDAISHVAFFEKDTHIVSTAYNGEVVIWDIASGEKSYSWKHKSDVIRGATISPDEQRIAFTTIYPHQGIYLCNIKTGEIVNTLKGHTQTVNSVAFSPDGSLLASASDDNTIICWGAETGEIIWQLYGFAARVSSLTYSHNGKFVVAITDDIDNPIVVCDSQSGNILVTYRGLVEPIDSVSISPDDRRIVSAGVDGTLIIWDFPPLQELINQTCERFKGRPLTSEERKQYYLE